MKIYDISLWFNSINFLKFFYFFIKKTHSKTVILKIILESSKYFNFLIKKYFLRRLSKKPSLNVYILRRFKIVLKSLIYFNFL